MIDLFHSFTLSLTLSLFSIYLSIYNIIYVCRNKSSFDDVSTRAQVVIDLIIGISLLVCWYYMLVLVWYPGGIISMVPLMSLVRSATVQRRCYVTGIGDNAKRIKEWTHLSDPK